MANIRRNVANSKLLVEATKNAVEVVNGGSNDKYVVQFGFRTIPIGGLTAAQANTFLGKCKQALGVFKDDVDLNDLVVQVSIDTSAFDRALITKAETEVIEKLGLNSGKKEKSEPEAAPASKAS